MVRLDKFLCDCNVGTRSQVKDYIRSGLITVNRQIVKKADIKIEETKDLVTFRGEILTFREFAYYMLNKPQGVVSATVDHTADTVLALLKQAKEKDLFPVGRLDKDTTGLLLITNDGNLAHQLLSPKKHVDKTYLVGISKPLTSEEIQCLEKGVDIGDEALTMPAKVKIVTDFSIYLTIQEGRFHQVKRMLKAVGNEVISLKRISFGALKLDETLQPGEYRELTSEELNSLMKKELSNGT